MGSADAAEPPALNVTEQLKHCNADAAGPLALNVNEQHGNNSGNSQLRVSTASPKLEASSLTSDGLLQELRQVVKARIPETELATLTPNTTIAM